MVVPTHSNNKSSSLENTGVPVLFSIKNVQPLILAARPATNINSDASQSSGDSITPPQIDAKPTNNNLPVAAPVEMQPKLRRSSILSKAIVTVFLVMLVVLVIRFSVPGPKPSTELVDSATSTESDTATNAKAIASMVTGPESSTTTEMTRVASIPSTPAFNLGPPEAVISTSAPDVPALPPLLSTSGPKDAASGITQFANNGSTNATPSATSPFALQPPVASQGMIPAVPLSTSDAGEELPQLDLSYAAPTTTSSDATALNVSSQASGQPNSTTGNLNVLDTMNPDRSLAEFEWLFRNATQNPLIPYRSVSAGGHTNAAKQPTMDGLGTQAGAPSPPVNGYQPITIPADGSLPAYERGFPGQPTNRYQPIRQPQRSLAPETSTSQTPYQPLTTPDTPPTSLSGTSFGYPPVQYPPAPNTQPSGMPTSNAPAQSPLGQQ